MKIKKIIILNFISLFISVNTLWGADFSTLAPISIFTNPTQLTTITQARNDIKIRTNQIKNLCLKNGLPENLSKERYFQKNIIGENEKPCVFITKSRKCIFISKLKEKFTSFIFTMLYYTGYGIGAIIFDIAAVGLLISFFTLAPGNIILTLVIIFTVAGAILSVLDAISAESAKVIFRNIKENQTQKIKKSTLLNRVTQGIQDNPMDIICKNTLLLFIENIKQKNNTFISSKDIILFIENQQTLTLNQKLYVYNFLNVYALQDNDYLYQCSKISREKNETLIKKVIYTYFYVLKNLKENKNKKTIEFIVEQINFLAHLEDEENIIYINILQKTLSDIITVNSDKNVLWPYLSKTLSDENKIAACRVIIKALSTSPIWDEDMLSSIIELGYSKKVHPKWIVYLLGSRKDAGSILIRIFEKYNENPGTQKYIADILIATGNQDVLIYLEEYADKISNPQRDAEKESLAQKIICGMAMKYMQLGKKNKAIQTLEYFSNKKDLHEAKIAADDLLFLFKNDKGKSIFDTNLKKYYDSKQDEKIEKRKIFYYILGYSLGALIFYCLIFYPIFLNPFSFLPVTFPIIVVSIILTIGVIYLQIIKGVAKNLALVWAVKQDPFLKNVLVKNRLNNLANDPSFTYADNLSFIEEKIGLEFKKLCSQTSFTPSLNNWRCFYVAAFSLIKNQKNITRALASLTISLNKKEITNFSDQELLINKLTEDFNLSLPEKIHLYNLINPSYTLNFDQVLHRHEKKITINHFEIDYMRISSDSTITLGQKIKFLYFIGSLYLENKLSFKEKERACMFLLRKLKYHYHLNSQEDQMIRKTIIEILQSFVESNLWEESMDFIIKYIDEKEIFNGGFFAPIFQGIYIDGKRFHYFMDIYKKSSVEKSKTILYMLSCTKNFQPISKKDNFFNIFLCKRISGYTIFFLIVVALVTFGIDFALRFFGLTVISPTYFIFPIILMNVNTLIGRFAKDAVETTVDNKVSAKRVKRYTFINPQNDYDKKHLNVYETCIVQYRKWIENQEVVSYREKKERLYEIFTKTSKEKGLSEPKQQQTDFNKSVMIYKAA